MDWVVILMSLSAGRWHLGGMTMFGGTGSRPGEAGSGPRHVPIVIGASPELRPPVWVGRVVYAAVMPILLVTARVIRPGVDPARDCADFGRTGVTTPARLTALRPAAPPMQENRI
jgi:hypothetical protein